MFPYDALANGLHLDPEAHRRILTRNTHRGHESRDVAVSAQIYRAVDALDRAYRTMRHA